MVESASVGAGAGRAVARIAAPESMSLEKPSEKSLAWLWPLVIGLVAALPSLGHEFTNDDEILIVSNRYVTEPGHLHEALTQDYFSRHSGTELGRIGYWRPLTKASFTLEYRLFGGQPWGFYLVSLAWFLLAIGAGFLWVRALGASRWTAAAVLGLFAAHPAHAEATSLIAARSDLAASAAMLVCLWAYVRWRGSGRAAWLGLALAAEVLALGHKEVAVLTPGLLACCTAAARPPERESASESAWRSYRHLGWFLLPLGLYGAARFALAIAPDSGGARPDLLPTLAASAKLLVSGVLRAFAPSAWVPYLHEERPEANLATLLHWGAPALALAGAGAVLARRRYRLRPAVGLLALPILLIVATQPFVRVTTDERALVFADRWLLLPALGAAWLAVRAAERLAQTLAPRVRRPVLAGAAASLVLVLGSEAVRENLSFATNNRRLLYVADALRELPAPSAREREQVLQADTIRAYEAGDYAAAVAGFTRLLELHPTDYNVRHSLAFALYNSGEPELALHHAWIGLYGTTPDGQEHFPATDSFTRKRPAKAFLLGVLLEQLQREDLARRHYELALELNPAHANAAAALARLGRRSP